MAARRHLDGGDDLHALQHCRNQRGRTGNGHHMINKSGAMAIYLDVGSRHRADVTTCSDIDMMSTNADGRFVHKDGTPYPER
jgi:uncharacterized cupin superfamily protein